MDIYSFLEVLASTPDYKIKNEITFSDAIQSAFKSKRSSELKNLLCDPTFLANKSTVVKI